MFPTEVELELLLVKAWEDVYSNMVKDDVMTLRNTRIHDFDGKSMPEIHQWPKEIRTVFFAKHTESRPNRAFILFVFFIGNGYSAYRSGTWLLTYYALLEWNKRDSLARKMIASVVNLYGKMRTGEADYLTYYDVNEKKVVGIRESSHLKCVDIEIDEEESDETEEDLDISEFTDDEAFDCNDIA